MNKKREMNYLNHGGRLHENVESLCLYRNLFKLEVPISLGLRSKCLACVYHSQE